jgi:hypothetical protein
MWKPVPIKKSDIRVGQKCVTIQVNPAQKLSFDKFRIVGKPVKKGTEYYVDIYKPQKRKSQSEEILHHIREMSVQKYREFQRKMDFSFRNLTHLGVILEKRVGRYGRYNRTFKATPATIRFFEEFSKKENILPAWLEFIGITDSIDDVEWCIAEVYDA